MGEKERVVLGLSVDLLGYGLGVGVGSVDDS